MVCIYKRVKGQGSRGKGNAVKLNANVSSIGTVPPSGEEATEKVQIFVRLSGGEAGSSVGLAAK